ncbi:MAG: hypothetical protein N2039_04665 [Gemmataceae bacterium]|nr:hypothetical protein [Gemmataceae bacterium]
MRKVCPQCRMAAPGQLLCPTCGVPIVEVAAQTTVLPGLAIPARETTVRGPTIAERLISAILAATGGFFSSQLLLDAWAHWQAGVSVHQLPWGPPALAITMLFAAFIGGLLIGAGSFRSIASGAIVGLAMMIPVTACDIVRWGPSAVPRLAIAWLIVPLIAALGGRHGRFLFPPWTDVSETVGRAPIEPVKNKRRERSEPVKIAWLRIVGGAALAVGCTVWAGRIREYILGTSGGLFTVDSRLQIHFVTWVIASLAVLVGGIFAGASTRAGLRHGLLVGIVTCVAIFVIYSFVVREALPAERFFAAIVGLAEEDANSPSRVALFLLTNSLVLSILGGWIGSMLLPPTVQRSRLDRAAV